MSQIRAAVIGDPISHSLSPAIHNFLLSQHKINGTYSAILVTQNELENFVQSSSSNGLSGFNVTIPHKEKMFLLCDYKSKTAELTGAVNTVVITADNKIFGHNSDAEGFANHLKNSLPEFDLSNKNIFIVGAGGAARALVYALIKAGVKKIFITNRNQIRAEELIKNFHAFAAEKKCQFEFCDKNSFTQKLNECDLLVNASSLGMLNQEPLELDLQNLNPHAVVYDIVYKPLMTDLLKDAQSRGNKIVTGLGMLVFQALIGFELWFKQKPNEKFVREVFTLIENYKS